MVNAKNHLGRDGRFCSSFSVGFGERYWREREREEGYARRDQSVIGFITRNGTKDVS